MPAIELTEQSNATYQSTMKASVVTNSRDKSIMVQTESEDGDIVLLLTTKQARALAGWINSNVPRADEGIKYED